jgi:hypothetical protein
VKQLRTIITPQITTDLAATDEPLTYWKQILPEGEIHYDGRKISFDRSYLQDLITSFDNGEVEQTMFQLANPLNSHGRDFDPERQRAVTKELRLAQEGEQPGLYAKLQFFNKRAAKAVRENPGLGVSARVRENFVNTRTGQVVKRAVVHVLGTIDPRVTGMSPWQAVDLSGYDSGVVVDLSQSNYQGVKMAKKVKTADLSTETLDLDAPLTAEQIAKLSDEQIQELLAKYDTVGDADLDSDEDDDDEADDDDSDDTDSDEDSDDTDADDEPIGDTNLSRSAQRQIDLAQASAREANARANEALRRAADADWQRERAEMASKGVPPVLLDLAAPILNRPDSFEVDLSNEGGKVKSVNVGEIMRKMLAETEGTIDMSNESGHGGGGSGEGDPDAETLGAWESQFPAKR